MRGSIALVGLIVLMLTPYIGLGQTTWTCNSVVLQELTITGSGRVQVKGKFPLNFGQLSSQTLDESAKVMYN